MVCLSNGCQPLVVRNDGVEVVAQNQRGGEMDRCPATATSGQEAG
jgi:hypothetical protein